jgi:signal transduction histidine kinase
MLTIFLTGVTDTDRPFLDEASRLAGVQVVNVSPRALPKQALVAVARGPVICVVRTDREAGQALGLGIDEVLRAGEVTREALAGAMERASSRAAARSSPKYRRALLDQDDDAAFAMLGAALGERLETPLAMAAVDCAAIAQAMNCLIDVDDQFVAWTALVAPPDQLRNLVARRLVAPTSPELRGVLKRLRASIGRAESLVRLLRDLTRSADPKDHVAVGPVIEDVVDVMRQILTPWCEVAIQADSLCVAAASHKTVVAVIGALLANAVDAIRAAPMAKGTIALRAFEEEEAVIVELRHNGRETPSDLRPELLDSHFGELATHRGGLPGLRDRLRRTGGDLLVDSDPTGTTVRVFFPSARAQDAAISSETPSDAPESPKARS